LFRLGVAQGRAKEAPDCPDREKEKTPITIAAEPQGKQTGATETVKLTINGLKHKMNNLYENHFV